MARIPDMELERLKRETSVQRLVEAKGIALTKTGADTLMGRCPFHDDKTPSLAVSPKKNVWHCLGACSTGGSVIDWVMKAEGVSFRAAVELLREGVDLSGAVGPRVATVPKLPCPLRADVDGPTLLGQVRDYYHRELSGSVALDYLEKRKLKHAELIDSFKLGFADRTLGLRLPETNRAAGAALRGRLQGLGVLRDTGHEHLRGSLVVPLDDESGAAVSLYGRKVNDHVKPGAPLHLYLPGPHRVAFNSAALKGQRSAIVCEALLDAMSFWVNGHRNVTAAYGVEGFTPHHLAALKRHQVKEVFIAYDRDEAGNAAAEKLAQALMAEGLHCWRVLFPHGMDANSYLCTLVEPAKAFDWVLRQAAWMGNGVPPSTPNFESQLASSLVAERSVTPPTETPRSSELASSEGREVVSEPPPRQQATAELASAPVSSEISPPPSNMPATPAAAKPPELEVDQRADADEVAVQLGARRYRVRGLSKALSPEALKVNVLVSDGALFHVDTLDMYSARHRAAFVRAAVDELRAPEETLKAELGQLLLKLEALQEQQLKEKLAPKAKAVTVNEEDAAAALELLRAPNLLGRIAADFERCGVVGEESNKLVGYLAAVSRKLEEPLAVLIQSSSAAGKSSLMEAVLAFVPDEDKVKYSAMTGQSLFYMGDLELKHKVLAVVEEEGAAKASYALKLLQSEGELTIASTGKDPATGKLVTHEYRVEGPTQLFLTTTASEVDEELLNRCLVLTVDEERGQTKAIHDKQREKQTLEGQLGRRDKAATLKVHQDAQRLLRPLLVANPFAPKLTFLDDRTRARRDFPKYLTLIRTLALLHQHQRPVKTVEHRGQVVEYVEATLDDVKVANQLAAAALGRSLDDLPPQTRRLLSQLDEYVKGCCKLQGLKRNQLRFTRRQVREALHTGDTQLKLHLGRLLELEYLRLHRAAAGGWEYELLYEGQGQDGSRFLVGLANVEQLRHDYDDNRSGFSSPQSGAGRPVVGTESGAGRPDVSSELLNVTAGLARNGAAKSENALRANTNSAAASYAQV